FLGTQNGLFIFEDDLISNVNSSYNSSSILEIYPNPTNDYISVLINDEYSEFSNICIYDEMGKIIFTSQLKDTKYLINNALDIDISKLTPGVYFVRASAYDSNKTTVKSFVKY
ncbi:MAG: T9SS type A sorting domain-containing protein, partial [Bacteroidales bacterium]|nr:T9SS type A sorting domain-containing protein [Bacteroidales bacterium]